jgi:hydroxymethylpyrimidine pyrophosphatase-like HAD family hydrolase
MDSAENILRRIRMFVTDADGTLMGRRPEFEQYRAFRSKINDLRNAYGAVWVVCTGRTLRGYKHIFGPMNSFGIKPDYVITCHAYIYECKSWGVLPHWFWNLRILWLQFKDDLALRRAMPRLKRAVLSHNPFAKVAYSSRERLCFRFEDEGAARFGADILRSEVRSFKYLQLFESPGEVEIRVIPFTKGLAVKELARHLGVANAQILVVGDGHNDISMIEMKPPCHTACPSNAAAEVIETVHRTHGHIASERSLGGVMEVITAYESGRVNDKLPEGWDSGNHVSPKPRPSRGISGVWTLVVLFLVFYTTLLALCTFVNVPGRRIVMKPYTKLVETISLVMDWARK